MFRTRYKPLNPKAGFGQYKHQCLKYCLACLLWILLSDRLLAAADLPVGVAFWIGTFKGIAFVFATTALLYFVLKRDNEKLQEAHAASLNASLEIAHRLAQAIELRDVATGKHNERIAGYCRLLGNELGMEADLLDRLERAAPLHDVGKIAIPDCILQKAGPLTAEETRIVRQHAILGSELLHEEGSPFMMLASSIALTHHEAWDGSGYPFGLKGDEIPLEGRIVAVCDVFDALLSERPYKQAWEFHDAVAEILRLSGTKFDPQIVEAFSRALPALESAKRASTPSAYLDRYAVASLSA